MVFRLGSLSNVCLEDTTIETCLWIIVMCVSNINKGLDENIFKHLVHLYVSVLSGQTAATWFWIKHCNDHICIQECFLYSYETFCHGSLKLLGFWIFYRKYNISSDHWYFFRGLYIQWHLCMFPLHHSCIYLFCDHHFATTKCVPIHFLNKLRHTLSLLNIVTW